MFDFDNIKFANPQKSRFISTGTTKETFFFFTCNIVIVFLMWLIISVQ